MAGLLDFLNTADGQVGLGLLAAAGPRSDGAGFGQRLMEGVGAGDAWKQRQQALAMQKMQMDNYASEIETRKASIANKADTQAALERILGGGGSSGGGLMGMSPGAFQPSADGMGPTLPAPQPNRPAGIGGMSINDVAALKGRGIDLFKEFEWANNPQQLQQGSTYQDRISGKERYMPKVGEGVAPNAQGVYAELPGYGPAQASIEGAKTSATEAAKAGLDLVSVPTGNGQTMMVPRARAVQMLNGQAPPSQPATGPAGYANEGQMRNTVAGDMGADPKALQREISAVKSDLMKPLDPASKLALQTHLSDLMGQVQKAGTAPAGPAGEFGKTQNPAEKDAQEVQQARSMETVKTSAKAGADRIMTGYDNARSAVDTITTIGESRKAIQGGSFVGAGADTKLNISKGLNAIGFNITPEQVSNTDYLNSQLGQGILNKAKTLGANPTDNDARIIRDIVGSIGKDPQALNRLLDFQETMANKAITLHNKNYTDAKSRGFDAGFDLTVDSAKTDSSPAASQTAKVATLSDITATAKASGRSTAEVTQAFRAKGYKIGGM